MWRVGSGSRIQGASSESREHPPDPEDAAPAPNRCFKDLDFEERGETEEGREGGKRGSGKKVREGRMGRRKEEKRRSEERVREEWWEELPVRRPVALRVLRQQVGMPETDQVSLLKGPQTDAPGKHSCGLRKQIGGQFKPSQSAKHFAVTEQM